VTPGRRGTPLALPVVQLTLLLVAGGACRREPPVARAVEVQGAVERDRDGVAQPVVGGTVFALGDTLRTGAASQTRLALTSGGGLRVGEKARLRFQRGMIVGRPAPEIAVELGSAEIEETASDVSIVTALGAARVARGARVRVRADGETTILEVLVGRAVMMDGGHETVVDAGQGLRIKIGNPEIQRFALKVGDAIVEEMPARQTGGGGDAAAPAEAPPGPPAALPAGPAPASGQGNRGDGGHADITLTAGESATIHDGRPPAAVRLRTDGLCPADVVVELAGGGHRPERITGAGAVVLRLTPGARSYRVRCAEDPRTAAPRASGTLTTRRDLGYVPLTRQAPVNVIDADGRKYTVLFQTRLPQLTLAWPGGPSSARALELHVESGSGEHVVTASPTRPLPRETVQEGTYTLWYRTPEGKQSPRTTLNIRFDNAAPTAQFFRLPADTERGPRAIPIDGVTIEGAKVSVAGEPLAVDAHGRFRSQATPPDGEEAVAVRVEHPRIGVHYYVRRRADAR